MESHLATFRYGPLHGEQRELDGRPKTYRALEYTGESYEEYLRGLLPSMPVQTRIVEYEPTYDFQDSALVYELRPEFQRNH